MTEQPARERTAEEQAAIERGGKRWAIGICLALVAAAVFIATRNVHATPTPEELKADAARACEKTFIPDRLKAPSTAQYTNVRTTESGGAYTVMGYVDAQNSFGAQIRSSFTCIVHSSGDQWVLDSASVN